MLNKPINPQPYFQSVDIDNGLIIQFEVPNGNFDMCSINIFDADTDDLVEVLDFKYDSESSEWVSTSESVTKIATNSDFIVHLTSDDLSKLANGKDYYWNAFYSKIVDGSNSSQKLKVENNTTSDGEDNSNVVYSSGDIGNSDWNYTYEDEDTSLSSEDMYNSGLRNLGISIIDFYTMHLDNTNCPYKEVTQNPRNYALKINEHYCAIERVEQYQDNSLLIFRDYKRYFIRFTLATKIEGITSPYNIAIYNIKDIGFDNEHNSFIEIPNKSRHVVVSADVLTNGTFKINLANSYNEYPAKGLNLVGYSLDAISYNKSPDYYFQARSAPKFKVITADYYYTGENADVKVDNVIDENNVLRAPQGVFRAEYIKDDGEIDLDYFYYNVWREEATTFRTQRKLVYQSPKYSNIKYAYNYALENPLIYRGFSYGYKYYIECIGIDKDGNSITSDNLEIDSHYTYSTIDMSDKIKCGESSVKIDTRKLLSATGGQIISNGSIYIYRQKLNDDKCEFVGKGLIRNYIIDSACIEDFAVANHSDYHYIFSVCKGTPSTPYAIYKTETPVHTDFEGAYIASIISNASPTDDVMLTESSTGSRGEYIINTKDEWSFALKYDATLSPITYNLSREKVEGFGKHYKMLRGELEAVSSDETYLLGGTDEKCDYAESSVLQKRWKDFVQNQNLKFYRPYVGEPMIVDIESYTLQPAIYSSGVVNELKFNYAQVDNCDKLQMQIDYFPSYDVEIKPII